MINGKDPHYTDKLKQWLIWSLAVLLFTVLNALVAKWIGGQSSLPPPPAPVIVVSPADGPVPTVTVVKP